MAALRVRWLLDGITFNGDADNDGVLYVIESERGWSGSTAPRSDRSARAGGGSYRGSGARAERVIELTGWAHAPNWEARRRAERRLAALCQGAELYRLVCTEELGDVAAEVQLDDRIDPIIRPGGHWLDYTIQLAAPDPVKYLLPALLYATGLPGGGTGLDWSAGGGLAWEGTGGLSWGTPSSSGRMVLSNIDGTAETWPLFTITGPADRPTLTNAATGQVLAFSGGLATGDTLTLDTHPFRRSVLLNGVIDRRAQLVAAQWFPVPRGGTVEVSFGSSDPSPTAAVASAEVFAGIS